MKDIKDIKERLGRLNTPIPPDGQSSGAEASRVASARHPLSSPQCPIMVFGPPGAGKTLLLGSIHQAAYNGEPVRCGVARVKGVFPVSEEARELFATARNLVARGSRAVDATDRVRVYRFDLALGGIGGEVRQHAFELLDGPGGTLFPQNDPDADLEHSRVFRTQLVSALRAATGWLLCLDPDQPPDAAAFIQHLPNLLDEVGRLPTLRRIMLCLTKADRHFSRHEAKARSLAEQADPRPVTIELLGSRALRMLRAYAPEAELATGWCSAYGFVDGAPNYHPERDGPVVGGKDYPPSVAAGAWRPFRVLEPLLYLATGELCSLFSLAPVGPTSEVRPAHATADSLDALRRCIDEHDASLTSLRAQLETRTDRHPEVVALRERLRELSQRRSVLAETAAAPLSERLGKSLGQRELMLDEYQPHAPEVQQVDGDIQIVRKQLAKLAVIAEAPSALKWISPGVKVWHRSREDLVLLGHMIDAPQGRLSVAPKMLKQYESRTWWGGRRWQVFQTFSSPHWSAKTPWRWIWVWPMAANCWLALGARPGSDRDLKKDAQHFIALLRPKTGEVIVPAQSVGDISGKVLGCRLLRREPQKVSFVTAGSRFDVYLSEGSDRIARVHETPWKYGNLPDSPLRIVLLSGNSVRTKFPQAAAIGSACERIAADSRPSVLYDRVSDQVMCEAIGVRYVCGVDPAGIAICETDRGPDDLAGIWLGQSLHPVDQKTIPSVAEMIGYAVT